MPVVEIRIGPKPGMTPYGAARDAVALYFRWSGARADTYLKQKIAAGEVEFPDRFGKDFVPGPDFAVSLDIDQDEIDEVDRRMRAELTALPGELRAFVMGGGHVGFDLDDQKLDDYARAIDIARSMSAAERAQFTAEVGQVGDPETLANALETFLRGAPAALAEQLEVSPERARQLSAWFEARVTEEEGGLLDGVFGKDQKGGERMAQALLGRSELGPLGPKEKEALLRSAASRWYRNARMGDPRGYDHVTEMTDALLADPGFAGDAQARDQLARIFLSGAQAMTADVRGRVGQTPYVSDGIMYSALKLSPAETVRTFPGGERELAKLANGLLPFPEGEGRFPPASIETRAEIIAAAHRGLIPQAQVNPLVSTMFAAATPESVEDPQHRMDWAVALARSTLSSESRPDVAPDPAAVDALSDRLFAIMMTDEGREMFFGGKVTPQMRAWALQQAVANPETWTAGTLKEGFESDTVVRTFAAEAFGDYATRAGQPSRMTGEAVRNTIAMAMGLPPDSTLPAEALDGTGTADPMAQKLYDDANPALKNILGVMERKGLIGRGGEVDITPVPVVVTSEEFGVMRRTVFRVVEPGTGTVRYVDDAGRYYESLDDWKENNKLPPGKMTYPVGMEITDPMTMAEPCKTPLDHWDEKLLDAGDKIAMGVGIAAGVVVIVGTAGVATPAVVATAAAVGGVGSGVYAGARAGGKLHDAHTHGRDITDLSDAEIRGYYIDVAAAGLSLAGGAGKAGLKIAGKVGASDDAARLIARGTSGAVLAENVLDAGSMINDAYGLGAGWEKMTAAQRTQAIMGLAFKVGVKKAGLHAGGKTLADEFSLHHIENELRFNNPIAIERYDRITPEDRAMTSSSADPLAPGQMRVEFDPDPNNPGRVTNIRIVSNGPPDPTLLQLHNRTARQLEHIGGLRERLSRMLGKGVDEKLDPTSAAFEARFEIDKLEAELQIIAGRMAKASDASELLDLRARQDLVQERIVAEYQRLGDMEGMGRGWIASPNSGYEPTPAQVEEVGNLANKAGHGDLDPGTIAAIARAQNRNRLTSQEIEAALAEWDPASSTTVDLIEGLNGRKPDLDAPMSQAGSPAGSWMASDEGAKARKVVEAVETYRKARAALGPKDDPDAVLRALETELAGVPKERRDPVLAQARAEIAQEKLLRDGMPIDLARRQTDAIADRLSYPVFLALRRGVATRGAFFESPHGRILLGDLAKLKGGKDWPAIELKLDEAYRRARADAEGIEAEAARLGLTEDDMKLAIDYWAGNPKMAGARFEAQLQLFRRARDAAGPVTDAASAAAAREAYRAALEETRQIARAADTAKLSAEDLEIALAWRDAHPAEPLADFLKGLRRFRSKAAPDPKLPAPVLKDLDAPVIPKEPPFNTNPPTTRTEDRSVAAPAGVMDGPTREILGVSGLGERIAGTGAIRKVTASRPDPRDPSVIEVGIEGDICPGALQRDLGKPLEPGQRYAPSFNDDPAYTGFKDLRVTDPADPGGPGIPLGDPDAWQRLHLFGPGFGDEADAGMFVGPREVNLDWQNSGIEDRIREMGAIAAATDGFRLSVRARARSWGRPTPEGFELKNGELFLKELEYEIVLHTPDGQMSATVQITVESDPRFINAGGSPAVRIDIQEDRLRNLIDALP